MKHVVRTNIGTTKEIDTYTRGKAIRIHCTECMGHESDPRDCTSLMCALYPYRKKTYMAYDKGKPADLPLGAFIRTESPNADEDR
jgi:hypothetical protein